MPALRTGTVRPRGGVALPYAECGDRAGVLVTSPATLAGKPGVIALWEQVAGLDDPLDPDWVTAFVRATSPADLPADLAATWPRSWRRSCPDGVSERGVRVRP